MSLTAKKALIIELDKKRADVKSFSDFNKYIGGVGLGLKLFQTYFDEEPIVFSIGPLNGFFPFASKTSVVLDNAGVIEDLYLGGTLSTRIKFAGVDAIVLLGKAPQKLILNIRNTDVTFEEEDTNANLLGLPGKRSVLKRANDEIILDDYFTTQEDFLEKKFTRKNISGMVVTGTETYKPADFGRYQEIYYRVLSQAKLITVNKSVDPSCSNCPMGCEKSRVGELGGNVLLHSLVTCSFTEKIYSDIGIVFSCLNVLGYDYTHEDIENLPKLIEEILQKTT